jgi:hypothetical protein
MYVDHTLPFYPVEILFYWFCLDRLIKDISCSGSQQSGKLIGSMGLAEVKSLAFGAEVGLQEGMLLFGFDPISHDALFEIFTHVNDDSNTG